MATEAFYVKKEDVEDFKKAKAMLGEDYSPFIMRSLKDYIVKSEMHELDYNTIQLFEGMELHPDEFRQGQYFKFVGKLLAEDQHEERGEFSIEYKLYLTRKGKYLLYTVDDDHKKGVRTFTKTIKEDVAGLRELKLPPELLARADKNMPDLFVEVLDI